MFRRNDTRPMVKSGGAKPGVKDGERAQFTLSGECVVQFISLK